MEFRPLPTRPLPPLRDINLGLLHVYRTTVECGGFSQAQAELGISRSTISTHMSNLETRLGLTLCRRGRSGCALTERGRLVYESASKFLTVLKGLRSELGELHGRVFRVEPELRPAAKGSGFGKGCVGRHGTGVVHESPAAHQWRALIPPRDGAHR